MEQQIVKVNENEMKKNGKIESTLPLHWELNK